MRFILLLATITLCVFSCDQKSKDYVTLSGKILNHSTSDTLKILDGKGYQKIISLNPDGSFMDTLIVSKGDYRFTYGEDYGMLFLKGNNTSSFTFDYNDIYNTLVYSGDDADINNFAIQNYQLINKHFSPDIAYGMSQEGIDSIIESFKGDYEILKTKFSNVDSLHIAIANDIVGRTIKSVEFLYASKIALDNALPKGSPSPNFENFENYNGGTTSLSDFKDKYLYLVFWTIRPTTYKKYFPALKNIEKKYQDKNIAFVSISLDGERTIGSHAKAREEWRKFVGNNKDLSGVQLLADKGWNSELVSEYQIKAIPRFVLIDPEGNIVTPDAPSPSNPKLVQLLDSLGI